MRPQAPREAARHHANVLAALQAGEADRAEALCREFLAAHPDSVPHLHLLARALTQQERFAEAEDTLSRALARAPAVPALHVELGRLSLRMQRPERAVEAFGRAIELAPGNAQPHRGLARALERLGRVQEAEQALEAWLARDPGAARIASGAEHLRAGRFEEAASELERALRERPEDVDALRFLALAWRGAGTRLSEAEALLRKALELAPDFVAALHDLGRLLIETSRWAEAAGIYERLIELGPGDAPAWAALGNAHHRLGDTARSLAAYARALECNPEAAGVHISRAHVLKTVGRQAEALADYRAATALDPRLGEAWWSMANLEVFRFEDAEVEAMRSQLQYAELGDSARIHFHFSLGKALEDRHDYDGAWRHFQAGNERQRTLTDYDPVEQELMFARIRAVFTPALLERRAGAGSTRRDPMFVVGLPCTGSTLIEQVLASHSQVEGTEELDYVATLAGETARARPDGAHYPETLALLEGRDFEAFARSYLAKAQRHRVLGRAHFVDSMPDNFAHLGWIKLMFPGARIIHVRRFPLDSCLGVYRQLFARGQHFSYDMLELSEYYRGYAALMEHWHALFPGEILDVHYEETVTDFEAQVRRILDHCGLPFEDGCLQFHATERAVRTASSEQLRQPIDRDAPGLWKRYAGYLEPWREDLAEIIAALPPRVRELAG